MAKSATGASVERTEDAELELVLADADACEDVSNESRRYSRVQVIAPLVQPELCWDRPPKWWMPSWSRRTTRRCWSVARCWHTSLPDDGQSE